MISACITRRLGRKVSDDVYGERITVTRDRVTGSQTRESTVRLGFEALRGVD